MKIDKQQIEHIAKLARLELKDEEIKLYQGQLGDILEYIELLGEVDVASVEPTAQVTGLVNVLREDKVKDCNSDTRTKALEEAPDFENGYIKVKRVLD